MSEFEPQRIGTEDLSTSLIPNPIMFAEKIFGSKAVSGSITMPVQMHTLDSTQCVTTTIPFYLSNDFNLGTLTNEWGDMVNMDWANTFAEWTNAVASLQGETQVTMQSEAMSSKVWKGSKFSGFTVECLFVSTRRTINPLKIIKAISASALPGRLYDGDNTAGQFFNKIRGENGLLNKAIDFGGGLLKNVVTGASEVAKTFGQTIDADNAKKAVDDGVDYAKTMVKSVGMMAPLYYGVKNDTNRGTLVPLNNTTLTLRIGDWFEAPELIVSSISGITFSKEIIAPPPNISGLLNTKGGTGIYDNSPKGDDYGYPLWGKCTLSLQPYSMMTKEKFQSYFKFKYQDSPLDAIEQAIANKIGGITNAVDTFKNNFKLP